jgi:cytochrome c556
MPGIEDCLNFRRICASGCKINLLSVRFVLPLGIVAMQSYIYDHGVGRNDGEKTASIEGVPRMIRKITAGFAIIAVTASVALAGGHSGTPEEKTVGARNAMMGLYSFNLGILGDMMKGTTEYDAAKATAAAGQLAALAGADQSHLWIEGTEQGVVNGSRAKAEIWSDSAGFATQVSGFATATATLAAEAGNGPDALKAAFGGAGAVCGSCHKAYRGPRN